MNEQKLQQIEEGKQIAQDFNELLALAKKQGWFSKNWQPLTIGSLISTALGNNVLVPLLNKNGVDIAALNLPQEAWWVGGGFTALYMVIEGIKHIVDRVLLYKANKK